MRVTLALLAFGMVLATFSVTVPSAGAQTYPSSCTTCMTTCTGGYNDKFAQRIGYTDYYVSDITQSIWKETNGEHYIQIDDMVCQDYYVPNGTPAGGPYVYLYADTQITPPVCAVLIAEGYLTGCVFSGP